MLSFNKYYKQMSFCQYNLNLFKQISLVKIVSLQNAIMLFVFFIMYPVAIPPANSPTDLPLNNQET